MFYLVIIDCLLTQGDIPGAKELVDVAILKIQAIDDSELLLQVHNIAGIVAYDTKEFEDALRHFLICRDIAVNTSNVEAEIVFDQHIGNTYRALDDLSKALEYYSLSAELVEKSGNSALKAVVSSSLSIAELQQNELTSAATELGKSLTAAKDLNLDERVELFIASNSAIVHLANGDDDKALKNYEYVLERAEKEGDLSSQVQCHRGIGVLGLTHDLDQAIESFTTSIVLAEQMQDTHEIAFSVGGLSMALFEKSMAQNIENKTKLQNRLLEISYRQIQLAQAMDNYELQVNALEYIAAVSLEMQDFKTSCDNYVELADQCESRHDYERAAAAYRSLVSAQAKWIGTLRNGPQSSGTVTRIRDLEHRNHVTRQQFKVMSGKATTKETAKSIHFKPLVSRLTAELTTE